VHNIKELDRSRSIDNSIILRIVQMQ